MMKKSKQLLESEIMNNNQKHVVFGASGGAGSAVVRQLARSGKSVRAVSRSGNHNTQEGIEVYKADALNREQVQAACEGAAVVYHCVNVPYPQWYELLPSMMENLIHGASEAGARLVYVDNLYMFGEGQSPMQDSKPYHPTSRKGKLRQQSAETLLAAHQAGQVQAAIGRGSDFYGPGVTNSMLGERAFPAAAAGKAAQIIGDPDAPHTYTYIDDFARGIEMLGEREEALGRAWHIGIVGHRSSGPVKPRVCPHIAVETGGVEEERALARREPALAAVAAPRVVENPLSL